MGHRLGRPRVVRAQLDGRCRRPGTSRRGCRRSSRRRRGRPRRAPRRTCRTAGSGSARPTATRVAASFGRRGGPGEAAPRPVERRHATPARDEHVARGPAAARLATSESGAEETPSQTTSAAHEPGSARGRERHRVLVAGVPDAAVADRADPRRGLLDEVVAGPRRGRAALLAVAVGRDRAAAGGAGRRPACRGRAGRRRRRPPGPGRRHAARGELDRGRLRVAASCGSGVAAPRSAPQLSQNALAGPGGVPQTGQSTTTRRRSSRRTGRRRRRARRSWSGSAALGRRCCRGLAHRRVHRRTRLAASTSRTRSSPVVGQLRPADGRPPPGRRAGAARCAACPPMRILPSARRRRAPRAARRRARSRCSRARSSGSIVTALDAVHRRGQAGQPPAGRREQPGALAAGLDERPARRRHEVERRERAVEVAAGAAGAGPARTPPARCSWRRCGRRSRRATRATSASPLRLAGQRQRELGRELAGHLAVDGVEGRPGRRRRRSSRARRGPAARPPATPTGRRASTLAIAASATSYRAASIAARAVARRISTVSSGRALQRLEPLGGVGDGQRREPGRHPVAGVDAQRGQLPPSRGVARRRRAPRRAPTAPSAARPRRPRRPRRSRAGRRAAAPAARPRTGTGRPGRARRPWPAAGTASRGAANTGMSATGGSDATYVDW